MRWPKLSRAADRAFAELGDREKHEVRLALAELCTVPHYPMDCRPIGNDGLYRKDIPLFRISFTFRLTDELVRVAYITLWNS